jgi:hypothetical protein
MNVRLILFTFGLANAVLYSAILPLWEGFDEPFHFGYVQRLANGQGLPDPRTTPLSREVSLSILLAPASGPVKHNLPRVTTFSEYFALPEWERAEIHKRLGEIPSGYRWQSSDLLNYEGHHPPLAYLVLAGPERLLARLSLFKRVLILRIAGAAIATILLYAGATKLYGQLGLPESYKSAAVFCVFSSQMTWATVAHVANDWLSVPLALWTLVAAVAYWNVPRMARALVLAALISAGLLTKAYFLALVPLVVVVCLARKRWRDLGLAAAIILATAAPWYIRNTVRYGTLTGMQEAREGVSALKAIRSIDTLDWTTTAIASLRAWLWTGNNSFTSFSLVTEIAMAAVWMSALLLWTMSRRQALERVVMLYLALFAIALFYATLVSHASNGGVAKMASPWYSQVLSAPMLGLAFLGCARSRRVGRVVASILIALFGYVLMATYIAKLIPLYGGYQDRTSLALLFKLYSERLRDLTANLDLVCLAPGGVVLALTLVVAALAVALMVLLIEATFAHESVANWSRPANSRH